MYSICSAVPCDRCRRRPTGPPGRPGTAPAQRDPSRLSHQQVDRSPAGRSPAGRRSLQPQPLGRWSPTVAKQRPHPHTGWVPAGLLGGVPDGLHTALQRLRGEVGVRDDIVENAAAELEGIWARTPPAPAGCPRGSRVEAQDLVLPDRAVVVEDVLPCHIRRITWAKSSICAVVTRGCRRQVDGR